MRVHSVVVVVLASLLLPSLAQAQKLQVERYNPSEWTKGRFTEAITVRGPGKTIYLAGIGAEDEDDRRGAIRHPADPYNQCLYSYDKIKRQLAVHGATMRDIVKRVVYVTDARYRGPVGKCTQEVFAGVPLPVSTGLIINGLAFPEMLIEIDIIAITAE
jgi:2-iminobutanoate/2-iminopropanoate deaminase